LIEAGNIDFTEGFKFRGLASSGGAALSVTQPIALLIALYLLDKRVIGSLLLTLFIVILFSSSMVIGRTGIILSVAEVKKTLLFSGYGSRMFLIIQVFSQLELLKVRKFQ